jgi:polyphenol oxidase
MNQIHLNNLPLWQFNNLAEQKGINHFVSGRQGGESIGELGGLNLSYKVGDDPVKVMQNRNALANAFSIAPYRLVFPVQTHSNNIKVITSDAYQQVLEDTDALVTKEKDILISVMSADCVPVLLYDPVKKAVAAIHAGWRGTMGEIVKRTIVKMNSEFGSKAENLIAAIGPSICKEVYEVGEEVINAVVKVYGTKEGIISNEKNGKGYCNLWEANRIQLLKAGVFAKNIEVAEICTYQNADLFFSARKSGNKAGRFAAGIMLTDSRS